MKLRFYIDLCKKFVILTWYQFWNGWLGVAWCYMFGWIVECCEAGEGQKMKIAILISGQSVLFCVLGCVL